MSASTTARLLPVSQAETPQTLESRDFSVEMETGTGKTYVYLRTALALHQAYGFRKFIIVVPSVAIREGVLKTLRITREHFARLYDQPPYRFYEYDSGNLARVRQFVASNDVEIMVMTLDAFNKDSNIFNRRMDRMMGQRPLDLVQAARPDPDPGRAAEHGERDLQAPRWRASTRSSSCATPPPTASSTTCLPAHARGRLQPAAGQADRGGLGGGGSRRQPRLRQVLLGGRQEDRHQRPLAGLRAGAERGRRPQDAHRPRRRRSARDHRAWTPTRASWSRALDAGYGEVRFANGVIVAAGEERGPDHEVIARVQIAHTIEEHMRKAHRLRRRGIKVLSLFFIDEVANYTARRGLHPPRLRGGVRAAAAAGSPWARPTAMLTSMPCRAATSPSTRPRATWRADADAYDLIMKDKERLLSFDEPVEFIFSHSALREGWDNPNIFQICTLNRTISTIRKRQEIGRGMRWR